MLRSMELSWAARRAGARGAAYPPGPAGGNGGPDGGPEGWLVA
ncbi:hypothetical protein OEB96_24635 [Paraliomyxa miuraensis]|nr:hypothetical protein [Paraliomyxa miuraensis]